MAVFILQTERVFTSSAARKDNTYLQLRDVSKKGYQSSTVSHHKLHESFFDELYYFATDNFFYIVKEHTEFGLVYNRTKDLRSKEEEDVITVSLSVAKFLKSSLLHQQRTSSQSLPSTQSSSAQSISESVSAHGE